MQPEQPRKLPRQERSRRLVEAVLDATARILAESGYARLTTNAAAERANVSIGSLYQYFPNKDALVAGVVDRHGRRVYDTIMAEAGAEEPASLDAAIRSMVAGVVAAHRIDPVLHGVLEAEMPRLRVFDGHAATVRAIADRLHAMPVTIATTIAVTPIDHAAAVVGEMVHALVHSVLIPPATSGLTASELETETVRAVIAYLTSAAPEPHRHHDHDHPHHHGSSTD